MALPDGGTVSTGGTVTLDGSGSDGGPWGTNVTYGWELTDPASGVTVMFDDDTSVTPEVTIPVLPADAELTFTLTVTGRGGIFGTAPGTDTATVTVTASADATLESLTVNDGTSDLTLAPAFASGTFDYTAQVGKAVTTVTLTAMTTDESATVDAVTLNGTAIADSDFTDGITVPSLLAGDNAIVETVRAEDTSTTQTYTVTVTREANAAPTAIDGLVTTNEDTAHTFAAAEFSFADADAGDALVRVTVVTPPAAGELALGGAAVTADQEVSAADIGQLVFTPASNAHGQDYASFTFKVSDGVDASALDYTMTVNVTAVNDPATGAPTIYGTAWVGRTPAVGTTGIEDVDGLTSPTYGYQWVRVDADGASNPTDITGETSDTYTLVEADVGKKLKVRVSFTDDGGNAETLTSDAYPSSGTIEVAPGICGRTAEVRNAIVHITDVSDCADVTAEHLAAITGTLHLSAQNITALRAGDFDGLTSLEELHLTHNELTTLPDGVFAGLTALTEAAAGPQQQADQAGRQRVRRADRAGDSGSEQQPDDRAARRCVRRAERADGAASEPQRAAHAARRRVQAADRADGSVSVQQQAGHAARRCVRAADRADYAASSGQSRGELPARGGGPARWRNGFEHRGHGDARRQRQRWRAVGHECHLWLGADRSGERGDGDV